MKNLLGKFAAVNWGYVAAFLFGLTAWGVTCAKAQAPKPKLYVYVDTLGISTSVTLEDSAGVKVPTEHPGIYITWVRAAVSPTAQPVSLILVAWDCQRHLVKRIAQIVYRPRPDSLGYDGFPSEPSAGMSAWQPPVYRDLFDLVCRLGPTHPPALTHPTHPIQPAVPADTMPAVKPQSPYPLS